MIRVYGSSDDLIEVNGDIYEEFNATDDDAGNVLAFSDGTLLSVRYDGLWRIHVLIAGSMESSKIETTLDADGQRDDGTPAYSDVLTLTGEAKWVVFGQAWARPK